MVASLFGKPAFYFLSTFFLFDVILCTSGLILLFFVLGSWNPVCQLEPEMKLKAVYTLAQQLYYGAGKALMACHG